MSTEVYWIEGPRPGRLGISARPRGGDWLQDEIRSWRASGVDVIVSLLTDEEVQDLDLSQEARLCQAESIEFHSFAIADRGVPSSGKTTLHLVQKLDEALAAGKSIVVHCRQGLGRSPLVAACLLVASGQDSQTAFQRIGAARGCPVPETTEQRQWVKELAPALARLSPVDKRS